MQKKNGNKNWRGQPILEANGLILSGPEFRGKSDKTKYRQFWRKE